MPNSGAQPLTIDVDVRTRVSGLLQAPLRPSACFVFAHGAGAGMAHPFMAAAAVRPHRREEDQQRYSTTLNLLMLVVWWAFLYAFIIFPDEYVVIHSSSYERNYNVLYFVENLLVLGAFGALTASTKGDWKKIYWHLLMANGLYATGSVAMNSAILRDSYYSGSFYDLPFAASVCWMISAGTESSAPARKGKHPTAALDGAHAAACDVRHSLAASSRLLGVVCGRSAHCRSPVQAHVSAFVHAGAGSVYLSAAIPARPGTGTSGGKIPRRS